MKKKKNPYKNKGVIEAIDLAEVQFRDEYVNEILKAMERICGNPGNTPEHRATLSMEWILRFAQTNLSTLSEAEWNILRYEVTYFAEHGPYLKGTSETQGSRMSAKFNWISLVSTSDIPEKVTHKEAFELECIASKSGTADIQKIAQRLLDNLIKYGKIEFQVPKIVISLTNLNRLGKASVNEKQIDLGWHKWISADSFKLTFAYYLVELLSQHAHKILQCPALDCQKIFLSGRKDQKYCSIQCQGRTYLREYRSTPRERIGKKGRPKKRG